MILGKAKQPGNLSLAVAQFPGILYGAAQQCGGYAPAPVELPDIHPFQLAASVPGVTQRGAAHRLSVQERQIQPPSRRAVLHGQIPQLPAVALGPEHIDRARAALHYAGRVLRQQGPHLFRALQTVYNLRRYPG